MARTLTGCNPELALRVTGVLKEAQGRLYLSEGKRTRAEQEVFYNAAVKKYGKANATKWAAKPGTSNHERGIAADIAVYTYRDNDYREQLCQKWGLHSPLDNEPWHFELDPARRPIATSVSPPKVHEPVRHGPATKLGKDKMRKDIVVPKGDIQGYVDTGILFHKFVNAFAQSLSPDRDGWNFSTPSIEPNNFDGQVRLVIKNNSPARELHLVVIWEE